MRLPRTFLFTFLIVSCAATLACGIGNEPEPKHGGNPDAVSSENVDPTLSRLKSAYESLNIMRMMDCLDAHFEGYLEFKSAVTKAFFSIKEPELLLIKDIVLPISDRVSVRLHWFKKWRDASGGFHKTQGSSQFVFKKAEKNLKLIYIRGNNPFF